MCVIDFKNCCVYFVQYVIGRGQKEVNIDLTSNDERSNIRWNLVTAGSSFTLSYKHSFRSTKVLNPTKHLSINWLLGFVAVAHSNEINGATCEFFFAHWFVIEVKIQVVSLKDSEDLFFEQYWGCRYNVYAWTRFYLNLPALEWI